MESILTSIKKLLGIQSDYKQFDTDLVLHINSVFMILTQLGVGPENGFTIKDETSNWEEFISSNDKNFEAVKSYMYLKVKLLFDPPLSSAVMESAKQSINELEWRLNVSAEMSKS